jgi:hypothetical protein
MDGSAAVVKESVGEKKAAAVAAAGTDGIELVGSADEGFLLQGGEA